MQNIQILNQIHEEEGYGLYLLLRINANLRATDASHKGRPDLLSLFFRHQRKVVHKTTFSYRVKRFSFKETEDLHRVTEGVLTTTQGPS